MAIKLEGGGVGKALMAWPLVEKLFFCGFTKNNPFNNLLSVFI